MTIDQKTGEIVEETSLATTTDQLPDYMRGSEGMGMEGIDTEDLVLPRLKLAQSLSPEVSAGEARPGDQLHSLTGENLGCEALMIVPVKTWKERRLWQPRKEGGGVLCQSTDGVTKLPGGIGSDSCASCDQAAWQGKEPPACTLYYVVACLLVEHGMMPIALSLSRTKVKTAKQLLGLARYTSAGAALFSRTYWLTPTEDRNTSGEFWSWSVKPAGLASAETFSAAKAFYSSMRQRAVVVDQDETSESDGAEEF